MGAYIKNNALFSSGTVDAVLFEDPALLAVLNCAGVDCDRCSRQERIAAIVKLRSSAPMLLCGRCLLDLGNLSRGYVA